MILKMNDGKTAARLKIVKYTEKQILSFYGKGWNIKASGSTVNQNSNPNHSVPFHSCSQVLMRLSR